MLTLHEFDGTLHVYLGEVFVVGEDVFDDGLTRHTSASMLLKDC